MVCGCYGSYGCLAKKSVFFLVEVPGGDLEPDFAPVSLLKGMMESQSIGEVVCEVLDCFLSSRAGAVLL